MKKLVKELKISWNEIMALIEKTYKISDVRMMRERSCERDSECYEVPDYVIGVIKDGKD